MMIVLLLLGACVCLGVTDDFSSVRYRLTDSSDVIQKDVCYGGTSQFRLLFFYGRMYFTPSKTGGSRKLVMEKGKVKDPRFKSSQVSVTLTKLTERDDGTFSVSIAGERPFDIVKLNILECAEQVVRSYKAMYSFNVPREAEFLEFTPILSVDQPRVLWNRTDPQTNTGGRGHVKHNVWEISELTQTDNGLYNFRKKDKTLLSRIKLIVKANTRSYELSPEERLDFTFDLEPNSCNIYFISESDLNLREFETEIVRQGRLERKGSDEVDCVGFQLSKPCGILIDSFQRSCVGRFEVRDQNGYMALVVSLKMKPNRKSYELSPGERLDFTFDLEPNSCNIYFISESDLNLKEFETEIVRQGRLQRKGSDEVNCGGFQLSKPCGILIESLQSSCGGRFEVIDQDGNKALVVSLKMKRRVNHKTKKTIRGTRGDTTVCIIAAVFLFGTFFCGCLKKCCGESSSREDDSETEAAAASAPEYEAVGLRSDELSQPSGTHYPAQPSYTPTGPLVHDPTGDAPPSYSEVVASAEQAAVPSAPVYSDVEPQFELKGMTFPSDSANVYTSDKLNFL